MVLADRRMLMTWFTKWWYWDRTSIRSRLVERDTCARLCWITRTWNEVSVFIEYLVKWRTRRMMSWWMSYIGTGYLSRLCMLCSWASWSKVRRWISRRSTSVNKLSSFGWFEAALRIKMLAKRTRQQRIVWRCMVVDGWLDDVSWKRKMVRLRECDEYFLCSEEKVGVWAA